VTNPLASKITWVAPGWAGFSQIMERNEIDRLIDRDVGFALTAWEAGSLTSITVDAVGWTGTTDKPTVDPVATWSPFTLAAGWNLLRSENFTLNGVTRTRFLSSPFSLPNSANNLALIIRADGVAGDELFLSDVCVSDNLSYFHYDYINELARVNWHFQRYTTDDLYGVDWGFGNSSYSGFNFPLNYPLRGRVGGLGINDVTVTWAGAWYAYGGGYARQFNGAPVLSCHHRRMIYFGVTFTSAFPGDQAFVYRAFGQPVVVFDAELRP
jgi:hypothetical protein